MEEVVSEVGECAVTVAAVMGQSPDRRDDRLSGRRDRYGAAAIALALVWVLAQVLVKSANTS